MNRKIVFVLLMLIIINTSISFADFEDKIINHWSNRYLNKDFIENYFDYLADNDYYIFKPDTKITKEQFLLSLKKLSNIDIVIDANLSSNYMTRKEAVLVMMEILDKKNVIKDLKLKETTFKDINNIKTIYKDNIIKAYSLGLISGYSKEYFVPNDMLTQAQAILLLQRIDNILKNISVDIPYSNVNYKRVYKEMDLKVEDKEDKVIVSFAVEFPNSGYSVMVDKVTKINDTINVYLNIIKPSKDKYYLDVISYKLVSFELNKNDLESENYKINIINNINFNKDKLAY